MLTDLNFELYENEVLGIIGPNGAGKTVMLNILTGIYKPSKGRILFWGEDITDKTINQRCYMGFGRTFQVPRSFEKMTVFENVIVGGVFGNSMHERDARKKAIEILDMIGLGEKKEWFAKKLSLIDRKRLEIGRALATDPKILLFDEVAGGLTESEVDKILDIVREIKSRNISVIWIEHVLQTMREGTDRILCIAQGRNIICGLPKDVMNSREVAEVYLGAEED